jgi:hypothetical protein
VAVEVAVMRAVGERRVMRVASMLRLVIGAESAVDQGWVDAGVGW